MTDNDETGSKAKGDKLAVDVEQEKAGSYDDKADDVARPSGATAPKTHKDPFTLGG